MTSHMPIATASPVSSHQLTLVLRTERDGPVLARVPVLRDHLGDQHSEAWWRGHARRGRPDVPLDTSRATLTPVFREDGAPWCRGFTLEAGATPGDGAVCAFPVTCLEPIAARAADELLASGVLAEGETYVYELRADPVAPGEPLPLAVDDVPEVASAGVRIAGPTHERLVYRTAALSPLLDQATPVGPARASDQHAILFLSSVRERAERVARKGAAMHPAVETGGVLIGSLVSCPETGDMFVVVTDVLEATDADGKRFSLTFSSATWAAIQTVLTARRRRPATAADRLVGSVHGHPFKIGGNAAPCDDCHEREICSRTSAFFSHDDHLWSRAVFAANPWQLGMVHGVDALDRNDEALYGLHGGQLIRRGYHELPDEAWANLPTPESTS